MDIFKIRLKKARLAAGLKQVDVMEKTGINNKTLSGYENGVSMPDGNTLDVLTKLYGVSLDWLFGRSEGTDLASLPPEDSFVRFMRYMEEKYNVELQDDPILVNSLHQLVETVALTKRNAALATSDSPRIAQFQA